MPELISTPPYAILQGTCLVTGYHNCKSPPVSGSTSRSSIYKNLRDDKYNKKEIFLCPWFKFGIY
jgi:hypothetical protein